MSNKRNVSKSELRRPSFIVRNRDAADIRPRLHSLHPLRNHPNLSRCVGSHSFATYFGLPFVVLFMQTCGYQPLC